MLRSFLVPNTGGITIDRRSQRCQMLEKNPFPSLITLQHRAAGDPGPRCAGADDHFLQADLPVFLTRNHAGEAVGPPAPGDPPRHHPPHRRLVFPGPACASESDMAGSTRIWTGRCGWISGKREYIHPRTPGCRNNAPAAILQKMQSSIAGSGLVRIASRRFPERPSRRRNSASTSSTDKPKCVQQDQ